MNMTIQNFFDAFTPLLLALHEKKVLDIAEVPHLYEDVLVRRKLDRGEDQEDLKFLQEMVQGLHRLAASANHQGDTPQP